MEIPTSWEPPFDLQAGPTQSRILTRSEIAFGFGADPSFDPVISHPTEGGDRASSGGDTGGMGSVHSMDLSSFVSVPRPVRSSAEAD
jgi:hypothetical protein